MEVLQTERLIVRDWEASDADFVFDMYSRWEVQRYLGTTPRVMADRSEANERIATWRALEHPVYGVWAVEVSATGALAGTLLLKLIPASGDTTPLELSDDTEIGWHFHPDFWGSGYATEAASAVLQRGFDGGLERIVAVTNPENLPSQRVCTRIGMQHQGLTDAYYNVTCELFVATAGEHRREDRMPASGQR
jgi:RimJ/RimL family protein N-acetyltransferase